MRFYSVAMKPTRIAIVALFFAITITATGCAAFRNTTYNLLPRVGLDGTKEFDFVIGVDLIRDLGGNEDLVVDDLLRAELEKRQYCKNGYVITDRGVFQGGGYLLYKGRCQ